MSTREQRLANFARVAVCVERREGFPADVMLTQWAIESSWGAKSCPSFNFFGIKYVDGQHDGFSWADTTEHVTDGELERLRSREERGLVRNVRVLRRLPSGKLVVALSDRFASFTSSLDAARGYVSFLRRNPRYSEALEEYAVYQDPAKLLKGIIEAGYGTGTGYVNLAVQICRQSNIQNAAAAARKMGDPCAGVED